MTTNKGPAGGLCAVLRPLTMSAAAICAWRVLSEQSRCLTCRCNWAWLNSGRSFVRFRTPADRCWPWRGGPAASAPASECRRDSPLSGPAFQKNRRNPQHFLQRLKRPALEAGSRRSRKCVCAQQASQAPYQAVVKRFGTSFAKAGWRQSFREHPAPRLLAAPLAAGSGRRCPP